MFPAPGDGIYSRKPTLVTGWHTIIRIFVIFVSFFVYLSFTVYRRGTDGLEKEGIRGPGDRSTHGVSIGHDKTLE